MRWEADDLAAIAAVTPLQNRPMQDCELIDILTYPGWVIAIGRTPLGYRCWVFTPDFTVLDDGEFYATSEAAAENARCLISDSREY